MLGRCLITAAVLALCLLGPATALAAEDEDEPFHTFVAKATNGYRVMVLAGADAGEPGEAFIFALHRSGERGAYYRTGARVTSTSVEADLGRLGRINLRLFKSGKAREARLRCTTGRVDYEKATYYGTFEFHGEQGFTDASANRIAYDIRPFGNLFACGNQAIIDAADPEQPETGALLRGHARRGTRAFMLEAVKNRQQGRVLVRASLRERRAKLAIVRSVGLYAAPTALDYEPKLNAAELSPPAPFSGTARFRRDATATGRWTGTLRVDFPGQRNVSLVRADLDPTLRRGSWHVRGGGSDRPVLGRPLALLEAP